MARWQSLAAAGVAALTIASCARETIVVKPFGGGFQGADSVGADAGCLGGAANCAKADGGGNADSGTDVVEAPCSPDATRCGTSGRERCDGEGHWQPAPCAADTPACIAGACVACETGAGRCEEGTRQRCDGSGSWVTQACPATKPLCYGGGCHFCLPNVAFCLGGDGPPPPGKTTTSAVCDGTGDDLATTTPCGAGASCVAGVCQVCVAEATRCSSAGTTAPAKRERCANNGGSWQPEACPAQTPLCKNGGCLACEPGSERCVLSGVQPTTLRERCDDDGLDWTPLAPCIGGKICDGGGCTTCVPGQGRCVGARALICGASGDGWVQTSDCGKNGLACNAGACSCAAAKTACAAAKPGVGVSTGLVACTGSGDGGVLAGDCGAGEACVNAACVACVAGASRCAGDDVQLCKPDGKGFALLQSCGDGGKICVSGACVDPCNASAAAGAGADAAGNIGCTFVGIDPKLLGPASAPATLHLLARLGSTAATVATWAAAPATQPSGSASAPSADGAGSVLSVALASLGAATGAGATISGQTPAFSVSMDQAASALLETATSDGSSGEVALLAGHGEAGVYRVVAWPSGDGEALAYFVVQARGESVLLALTPSTPLVDQSGATLAVGVGVAVTVPANSARIFYAKAGGDPTGTLVVADAAVDVLVGHRAARVPAIDRCIKPAGAGGGLAGTCATAGSLCFADADCPVPCCGDALLHALPAVARWGTVHAVARSVARGSEPDVVRIVAHIAGTIVVTSPPVGLPVVLDAGAVLDLTIKGDIVVVASANVAVLQLLAGRAATGLGAAAIGDPASAMVTPTHRGIVRTVLYAPASGWMSRHVAIAAPVGTLVAIDGKTVAAAATIGDSGFAAFRTNVAAGPHLLSCSAPCTGFLHGYGKSSGFATAVGWAP